MSSFATAADLAPGFDDPVHDAQRVFRRLLEAFAHPGRVVLLPPMLVPPSPLNPGAAALALTLVDHGTPLSLDAALDTEPVRMFLRFHCGAPIVDETSGAAFALVGNADAVDLGRFAVGEPECPERSTTVILQVPGFAYSDRIRLSGPGIECQTSLRVDGIDGGFWRQWQRNSTLYPCGVDVVFASPEAIAVLPRTVRVEI
jgi:alpha-D-ribose 1-methylphosphonate 5-triphosphate synthase subunit PhnH